ncbi:Hypothetical protein, putative [Bodo saltans]|uniref:Uncharacterized protein n=1 Tax=Bodo saltans TaxID=75058 RepID=A0A0S4JCF3_BODSA|nr:Hypothetical protein, putative [Bodo saltans]|eukprot:CUG87900.1 Hypothetical protein, putative [Bodo saltans]
MNTKNKKTQVELQMRIQVAFADTKLEQSKQIKQEMNNHTHTTDNNEFQELDQNVDNRGCRENDRTTSRDWRT